MGKFQSALQKSGKAGSFRTIEPETAASMGGAAAADESEKEPPATAKPASNGSGIDPLLVVFHEPASVEAEIFKILRNNILFPKTGTPPRSIMVTSAIPGDGKSFVAANLAISIAHGVEEHVLLMDCDMRRSTIHQRFGLGREVRGLSDYLSNGGNLSELLRKTVVDKLTILPGGTPPVNPSELLSSQAMRDLLEETKNRYTDRYIIVDSPPPHLTAETTALAKFIDGIIIVIRSGKTPRKLVDELIEKLGREKILGVVLNAYKAPATERYTYGRYRAYKNGYGYGYRVREDGREAKGGKGGK